MATKNLARTVIEGGRNRRNRWERRYSNARERVAARQVSAKVIHAEDLGAAVYPRREQIYPWFDDKLGPAERWLARQVGRPWNKVRGELMRRFDSRTTAGRHILFDHLLPMVDIESKGFGRVEFTVDRCGTLRKIRRAPRQRHRWYEALPEAEDIVELWLDGRRVGARETTLFWFTKTPAGHFRQARRLTAAEGARWRALPGWFRDDRTVLGSSEKVASP